MREYEVMHIHEPLPVETNNRPSSQRESLRLNGIIVNNNEPDEEESEASASSPVTEVITRPGATTTVIIRQKQSYLHRLSNYLTITRFLSRPSASSVSDSERLLQQQLPTRGQIRQDPDMKLKQRWILALFVLISIMLILLLSTVQFRSITKLTSHQLGITVNLEELTERAKCPACFGVNLCPEVIMGKIELNDWNKFAMSRLVNVKNVFYATWDDQGHERQVVLKKLAHNTELTQLDKSICDRHHGEGNTPNCHVPDAVINLIAKYKIENQNPEGPIILNGETIGKGSDLLLCPSHRKMDFFVNAAAKFNRGQHHDTILANMLTMILLNPEPLLLQAFPAKDGWPFPVYHGACGRLIAEEYIGRRLTTYYQEPFVLRAQLGLQLLEMANKFYENPTNFILYLTDMTPDNFAVDEETNTLKVIDLEDFIVVDKEVLIKSKVRDSTELLESESSSCGADGNRENMCFTFSPKDLCERPVTDHNYYAVCAGLLAPGALADQFPNGLLHSPPSELTDDPKFGRFVDILEKCKDPKHQAPKDDFHMTRVEAAQELIVILNKYLKSQQSQ